MNAWPPPASAAMPRMCGDHLRRSAPVHGADVAEQALEGSVQARLRRIPDRRGAVARCRRHRAQQVGFQDIVARQRLAARVQHREQLVRAIDVVGHVDGDVAPVEHEVGEAPALFGVEVVDRLVQMVARADDVFRAAGEIGLVHRHQRGAGLAHVRMQEPLVQLAQREPRVLRPRRIADGGPQPLIDADAARRVEIADDAQQHGHRRQALQAVDHVQQPCRARLPRERQCRQPFGGSLGLHEHHHAQEIAGALAVRLLLIERGHQVLQQTAGLVLVPGEGALIWWCLEAVGICKQLAQRHGLGVEWRRHHRRSLRYECKSAPRRPGCD